MDAIFHGRQLVSIVGFLTSGSGDEDKAHSSELIVLIVLRRDHSNGPFVYTQDKIELRTSVRDTNRGRFGLSCRYGHNIVCDNDLASMIALKFIKPYIRKSRIKSE